MAEPDDWKKCAEHWKAVADTEAARCALEYDLEIKKLRAENRRLQNLIQRVAAQRQ